MLVSRAWQRSIGSAGFGCAVALALLPVVAQAETRLELNYTITGARIPVGSITATAEIGDSDYSMTATGRATGFARVLSSGTGTFAARGTVKDGRLVPATFNAKVVSDDETLEAKMVFEDGNVTELTASPRPGDRVPLADAHRQGVIDPLSGMMIAAGESNGGLTQGVCQRTLAIFDGHRRFDLKLSFKRMDKVKADKGYAGPVVVCAVVYVPIAGHRSSSQLVKYLSEGRDIELALAPVAGTRVLAPFRMSVASMLANLVIEAQTFEVKPQAPRAPAAPPPAAPPPAP